MLLLQLYPHTYTPNTISLTLTSRQLKKVDRIITLKIFAVCCWHDPKYKQNDLFHEWQLTIQLIIEI
jgi:hypothetical protein